MSSRGLSFWSNAAVLGATAAGVLALPSVWFPLQWLAAFTLPGALFWWLTRRRAGTAISGAEAAGIAVLLQITLTVLLVEFSSAWYPQSALTYVLVPPLAFTVLRRSPPDRLLALFLSFCLLLIASVLARRIPWIWIGVHAVCAAVGLFCDASELARSGRLAVIAPARAPGGRAARALAVVAACLLAATGTYEVLRLVPGPPGRPHAGPPARRLGWSRTFDLEAGGRPLDLAADELLRVRVTSASAPAELYLRAAYFDVGGVERWRVDSRRQVFRTGRKTWGLRPRRRGRPRFALRVERLIDSEFVFLPPGTIGVRSSAPLLANIRLEHLIQRHTRGPITYEVEFQDLRDLAEGDVPVRAPELTRLPEALRTDELQALAAELARGAGEGAASVARALAAGLRRRCRYSLEEPDGPRRHALGNFLFGDRKGYCMHFASALAVLLRLRGVPCRIAVGLYGADLGPGRELVLGSRHAHAWVEVPFRRLGWVPFDATPPADLAAVRNPASSLAPRAHPERPAPEVIDSEPDVPWRPLWPWAALLALLLGAALLPRRRALAPRRPNLPGPAREARRLLDRLLEELARRGHPRPPRRPLALFAAECRARGAEHAEMIVDAVAAYQEVRFGGRPLDAGRRRRLEPVVFFNGPRRIRSRPDEQVRDR